MFQDGELKQFIYRHSRTVFDLLDRDASQSISGNEFEAYGFVFNLKGKAVRQIFNEFDVSGDRVSSLTELQRILKVTCCNCFAFAGIGLQRVSNVCDGLHRQAA